MENEKPASESFIIFELAGTTYALPSRLVQQMEMTEHITPVPNASPAIEGVVFTRGQVVPAINLRTRFGFAKIPVDLRTRLIVTNVDNRTIGLMVDSAREFISIPSDAIQPPGEAITGLSGKYLEGIATLGNRMILILNLDEVVNVADIGVSDPHSGAGV